MLGPWRQHFDDELRLRQNHRKTKKSIFCLFLFCEDVTELTRGASEMNITGTLPSDELPIFS
jgi:hypothetical protein